MNRARSIPALDGVRGVAILLVLALHSHLLMSGGLGVDLFFVLSGFLITSLLLSEWVDSSQIAVRGFYARRAFRLVPALVLLLTAYVTYGLTIGHIGSPDHVLTAAAIGGGYMTNLFNAASSGFTAHYLWHLWSLAEEEQFYLLWPLLLLLALRRGTRPRTLALVLALFVAAITVERIGLSVGGASQGRIWFGPDTHADALAVGCLAGLLWSYRLVTVRQWTAMAALAAAVAALAVGAFVADHGPGTILTVTSPIFPLACGLLVVHLANAPAGLGARLTSFGPLRYVGQISYGLYLWHFPLMHLLGVMLGLISAVVVAAMSHRYVEAPIRRAASKRWSRRPTLSANVDGGASATERRDRRIRSELVPELETSSG